MEEAVLWTVLGLVPWIGFGVILVGWVRFPRKLPPPTRPDEAWPRVTVIVPARNEVRNIERCLRSLVVSDYPSFDVVVVDDRSTDGTAEAARPVGKGNATAVTVIEGLPLPEGWFGKPWACHQGQQAARGELLLFTDADTWHGPELLARAVTAIYEDGADAVTLLGQQVMESFWERVLQPQAFLMLLLNYPNARDRFEGRRWRRAIANGQYVLIRRDVYLAIGGHEAVRSEVAEDLRLAQILTQKGYDLRVRESREDFRTRMYQSLGEIIEGWSKNVAIGARQILGDRLGTIALGIGILIVLGAWVLPPTTLLLSAGGWVSRAFLPWSLVASLISLAYWVAAARYLKTPAFYAVFYPLGALAWAGIMVRSWIRGSRRIDWKGRRYEGGLATPPTR